MAETLRCILDILIWLQFLRKISMLQSFSALICCCQCSRASISMFLNLNELTLIFNVKLSSLTLLETILILQVWYIFTELFGNMWTSYINFLDFLNFFYLLISYQNWTPSWDYSHYYLGLRTLFFFLAVVRFSWTLLNA